MFTIGDIVETGYNSREVVGGSVEIKLHFKHIQTPADSKVYLKIIDKLDHCLITSDINSAVWSQRYYRLGSLNNIYEDIVSIITQELTNSPLIEDSSMALPLSMTVKLDASEYTSELNVTNNIIEYGANW